MAKPYEIGAQILIDRKYATVEQAIDSVAHATMMVMSHPSMHSSEFHSLRIDQERDHICIGDYDNSLRGPSPICVYGWNGEDECPWKSVSEVNIVAVVMSDEKPVGSLLQCEDLVATTPVIGWE